MRAGRSPCRKQHNQEAPTCPTTLADLRRDLAAAYRILANEGVLDAFGHVSVRHPDNPNRYFLSRSRAPELVQPDDILEYDLDSNPVEQTTVRPYGARDPRRDLQGAAGREGGVSSSRAGDHAVRDFRECRSCRCSISAPRWAARRRSGTASDEFGDTNLLVVKPEEGASLARALGSAQHRADEPARRDRGRRQRARTRVPRDLFRAQRRISVRRAACSAMSRR